MWSFLDTYKKQGFELVGEEYNGKMTDENKEDVYLAMEFQHFMMSITTNPALRKMLQEKYEEENALAKEEADRPEKVKEMVLEAQTEAVSKEEIEKLTAEITELKQKIAEQKQKIEEQANIIKTQEGKIAALENERESHAKQVEQMNADFAEKQELRKKILQTDLVQSRKNLTTHRPLTTNM